MKLSGFFRSRGAAAAIALSLSAVTVSGCVLPPRDDPAALAAYKEANDPLEGFNRAIFGFNEGTDILLFRPAAEIYRTVLPNPIRNGIRNFLRNLRSPLDIANNLLQGDMDGAEVATKRFLVNTTAGVGGVMDIAADNGLAVPVGRLRPDAGGLGHPRRPLPGAAVAGAVQLPRYRRHRGGSLWRSHQPVGGQHRSR